MSIKLLKSQTLSKGLRTFFDGKLLSSFVFLASLSVMVAIEFFSTQHVTVDGIGWAEPVEHRAAGPARVDHVYVIKGQTVDAGELLLSVSPLGFDTPTVEQIDAEIELTLAQSKLDKLTYQDERAIRDEDRQRRLDEAQLDLRKARARLGRQRSLLEGAQSAMERAQRETSERRLSVTELWQAEQDLNEHDALASEASARLNVELARTKNRSKQLAESATSRELELAILEVYESQLELLKIRRQRAEILEKASSIRAATTGRISAILSPGTTVDTGLVLARVLPNTAKTVTAFLDPQTDLATIPAKHGKIVIRSGHRSCSGTLPIRRGAEVVQAPGQLNSSILGRPLFGLPLFIDLPPACDLAVGQVVEIRFKGR